MGQVYMLAKPNCPNCQKLKMFLKFALQDKYKNDIMIIDKVEQADRYVDMVKKFNVLSVPVLIHEDDVLIQVEPSKVIHFLEKYSGKK